MNQPNTIFRSLVSGLSGVTALVSARVYEMHPDKDPTFPLIVFTSGNAGDAYGPDNTVGEIPLMRPTIDVECYAETIQAASALAWTLHEALTNGEHTVNGALVQVFPSATPTPAFNPEWEKYLYEASYELWTTT